MASPQQNKIIIILAAVLAAIIALSAAILFLLSDTTAPAPSQTTAPAPTAGSSPPATVRGEGFNLNTLQRREYQQLNKQFVQEGALPVKPPANTGKANPFL